MAKLGDRVLPELMPIFFKALSSETSSDMTREGVCIGLTELINNCTRQLLIGTDCAFLFTRQHSIVSIFLVQVVVKNIV